MSPGPEHAVYSVYVVRCADGTLYTGIASDVQRRIAEHDSGRRGAKYLRGRGPLELHFEALVGERGAAQRAEHLIKQLPASRKKDRSTLRSIVEEVRQGTGFNRE